MMISSVATSNNAFRDLRYIMLSDSVTPSSPFPSTVLNFVMLLSLARLDVMIFFCNLTSAKSWHCHFSGKGWRCYQDRYSNHRSICEGRLEDGEGNGWGFCSRIFYSQLFQRWVQKSLSDRKVMSGGNTDLSFLIPCRWVVTKEPGWSIQGYLEMSFC